MKKFKITHIKIENFCGVKTLDADIHDRTLISGKNAVGKSTIRNAVTWVLFDKLADGSSATGIRPHDENGVDIDFVDIVVAITCEVDGREIVITKKQSQNWVKDRATQEQEFKGNVNEFFINDIPKKEKDFKAYLEENILSVDKLMFCMNPFSFLSLNAAKRRAKLFELASDFSDADVIAKNEDYKQLENDLKDGTLEELIARSKKAISSLKKTLEELPARIDEVVKSIVDMDFAELELQKNDLEKQIDDANKSINQKNSDIMKAKFDLSEVQRKANEDNVKRKTELDNEVYTLSKDVRTIDESIAVKKMDIRRSEAISERLQNELKMLSTDLDNTYKRVFDDSSLICPNCKQEYPADKKAEINAQFEQNKMDEIKRYDAIRNEKGNLLHSEMQKIEQLKTDIEIAEKNRKQVVKQISKLETKLSDIPATVDMSQNKKYVSLTEKIEQLNKELLAMPDIGYLQGQLKEVNEQLTQKATNIKAEERIAELKAEQRKTAQSIADQEKMLDLLESFNRDKIGMITDSINSLFDVITWVMFEKQINGGYKEVCNAYVGGTSYDGTLNHGDRLLAEIDICRAFSKANNIECPIIVDDTESIDSDRVPKLPCQIITLRRTDDEKLMIKDGD